MKPTSKSVKNFGICPNCNKTIKELTRCGGTLEDMSVFANNAAICDRCGTEKDVNHDKENCREFICPECGQPLISPSGDDPEFAGY